MPNKKMFFLNTFKNGFIDIIRENGFATNYFISYEENIGGYYSFIISLNNSPLQFNVLNVRNSFDIYDYQFTNFNPEFSLTSRTFLDHNVQSIYKVFSKWLNNEVKYFLNNNITPNLWEQVELEGENIFTNYEDDSEFEKYSENEVVQLRMSINEFKILLLEEYQPNDERLNLIVKRLEYLSDSLEKLNRFDWKGLALSTVISISIALGLDASTGQKLFELFRNAFQNILYLVK